jgi:Subtilase family
MSLGFEDKNTEVQEALELANEKNILVFAAMSNEGMHKPAAWPAKDLKLCVGIHSCTVGGNSHSDFTARPVDQNPNFMVVGEKIPIHRLTSKGGGFCMGNGTSFATPVAVSMGALILTFVEQKRCLKNKKSLPRSAHLDDLRQAWGMASLFNRASNHLDYRINLSYSLVEPELLWAGNRVDGPASREHAWGIIASALSPELIFKNNLKSVGKR